MMHKKPSGRPNLNVISGHTHRGVDVVEGYHQSVGSFEPQVDLHHTHVVGVYGQRDTDSTVDRHECCARVFDGTLQDIPADGAMVGRDGQNVILRIYH